MKKWFAIALASLLTLGMLAGCGSKSDSNGDSSKAKNVKLSFIHWRGEDTKVFNELISQFEQENPGITVEMNVFPSEQYLASAQSKLLDGSSGDVFAAYPGAQYNSIQQAGLYEDLSGSSFITNFTANLIEAGQTDGKQYAIPYQLVYNQPVYNKKIFEKLGLDIPADWDSFLEVAQKLKDNGYIPIAFPGADIGPGQFMNTMMMNNNTDEDIWTKVESGEAKVTDEWWVKTLTQFKELNDKGYFQKDSLGTKKDTASVLFAQEKAAMLATGSYMMSSNIQQNPNLEQGLLAPITVSKDEAVFEGIHTTTFMLGVNARSEHKEEAKRFIEFLSKPEVASKYANETGQLVTVKGVTYSTKELQESAEWMNKKTRFQPRYLISNANIEKAVVSSIQSVLAGKDPAAAAKDAQAIVDQNLKK